MFRLVFRYTVDMHVQQHVRYGVCLPFLGLTRFFLLSILQTVLDGRIGLNARSPEYFRIFHVLKSSTVPFGFLSLELTIFSCPVNAFRLMRPALIASKARRMDSMNILSCHLF